MKLLVTLLTVLGVVVPAVAPTETAAAWPQWLGPTQNGAAVDPGVFAGKAEVRLHKAWSHPLETGQAGLAVADGRVYTLFTDGADDYAIALRADDGAEAWRAKLDPSVEKTFLPGPVSTPAYDAGQVFTLSSACRLRCHEAASGRVLWEIDLGKRFGTSLPMGCGPSPFVEEGRLHVQTGGREDQRVVALDPRSGDVVWTAKGTEPANYPSPVAAEILGVRTLLVHHGTMGKSGLTGLRLADGALLWSSNLPPGFSFDTPLALPGGRVALATANETHVLQLARTGEAWGTSPAWRTTDLQAAVSPPVVHAGHLFGFGGDHLACVEAETGKTAWKEKLYPGSLILVDGHLVIVSTSAGLLRVVEASASGYRERARLEVLTRGAQTWAPPSYAGRRIFLRNEEEVVAIDVP
jgi:outer membrane protein assembly factor BamB